MDRTRPAQPPHGAPSSDRRPYARIRPGSGFTLVEVLVVMAIVGILSAFAYPAYRDHVIRGALTDAVAGLSSVAAQMERHYQDHRTYESIDGVNSPCRGDVGPRTFGHFLVSCSAAPGALAATSYTLRSSGSGPMSGFVFTLDHRGARATHAAPPGWGTCGTRWILKRGETC